MNNSLCPNCGYCPHCGRSYHTYGYIQYPYITWTLPATYTTIPNTSSAIPVTFTIPNTIGPINTSTGPWRSN